jgi:hypothetical protein
MRKKRHFFNKLDIENLINFLTSVDSVCSLVVVASVVLSSFLITDDVVISVKLVIVVDDEGDCVIRSEVVKSVAALLLGIVDDLSISVEIDASRVL